MENARLDIKCFDFGSRAAQFFQQTIVNIFMQIVFQAFRIRAFRRFLPRVIANFLKTTATMLPTVWPSHVE